MKFEIGDNVKDNTYGYEGTINKIFKNFFDYSANGTFLTTGDGLTWLNAQNYKHSQKQLMEVWYYVLCWNGGSIVVCESRLSLLSKSKSQ